ncbi:non-homologous end-joining DNA ligase [Saccharopolyspora mangrovi]|uniref:Non-homologous end-joining DNA ligase n=1 Tax=Saccharopolyspora mangrovi TaxID=3082379 RepID=A0ABU6AC76_9PSEU|nr:non-homologous end-joining DNA ligase [Saccharopolyspora sp. S2-29]MEB3369145.1 non-homologous end-joining DNA ligase [Saccharopolyspora sp. S2-29]
MPRNEEAPSNPDKVLYPQDSLRKQDVFDHYRSVSGPLIAHARGKPVTLRRFPDGIEAEGFFQKEASRHFPDWIPRTSVPQRGGGTPVHHVLVEDERTLLYLADQACLELHIALSTVEDLERPVLTVLDIDPPEGADIATLRSVVRTMSELLAEAGLAPHLQTTGGKGFHIAAPLDGEVGFEEVRSQMREIAERGARHDPDRLTTEQRKNKRGDRIFLDVNRNAYGQTMIAPYSLRARPGAPAATPIDPEELGRVHPRSYGLANMGRRLAQKSDPWRDLH